MTLETSSTDHASQRRMILAIVAFAALAPAGLMAASAIAGQLIEAQGDYTAMLMAAALITLFSLALIIIAGGASSASRANRPIQSQGATP